MNQLNYFGRIMEDSANSPSNLYTILQGSGLNEDCFAKILKYLNICDLLTICNGLDDDNDKSITNFVNEHIIKKRLFDFGEIRSQRRYTVNKVFEIFGHSIKLLKVSTTLNINCIIN